MKEYKYFAFDRANGDLELFETRLEAFEWANNAIDEYRGNASEDGWPDNMDNCIGWGKLDELTKETMRKDKEDFTEEKWQEMGYSSQWDIILDYELKKINNQKP